ncbi:unnamed protein product [Calypogeia fissa]
MKDCINEPHFRRDSQSRPNFQQTTTDIEDAPLVLPQPMVPPMESLHQGSQPQVPTASPFEADPLVRIPSAKTVGTYFSSPIHTNVPLSNPAVDTPLIFESTTLTTGSITLEEQFLTVDPSSGHAPQSITSPLLPAHLHIRTSPWPIAPPMPP